MKEYRKIIICFMIFAMLLCCASCGSYSESRKNNDEKESGAETKKIEIPKELQTETLNERQRLALITMEQPTNYDELDGYWKYQIQMTEYQLQYMDEKYGGYHICNYTGYQLGYAYNSYVTRCYEAEDPTREFEVWTKDGELHDNYNYVMAAKMVDDYMAPALSPYGDKALYYIEDVWQDGNYYDGELNLEEILEKGKIEGQIVFMESDSNLEIMEQRLNEISAWLNDNMQGAKGSILFYVQPDDYYRELTKANCKDMHAMRTIDYMDSEGKRVDFFKIESKEGLWIPFLRIDSEWIELK